MNIALGRAVPPYPSPADQGGPGAIGVVTCRSRVRVWYGETGSTPVSDAGRAPDTTCHRRDEKARSLRFCVRDTGPSPVRLPGPGADGPGDL